MRFYTIGYGGRTPHAFVDLLRQYGIRIIADVRLRPDLSRLGVFAKASSQEKGIERLLHDAGIGYISLVELGNIFRDFDDWPDRYRKLMDVAGALLTERLLELPQPFCLLCGERRATECHRGHIAVYLEHQGHEAEHL